MLLLSRAPALPFLLLLLFAATPAQAQPAAGSVLDEVVAVVGGEVVLQSEVDAVAQQQAEAAGAGQPVTDALWSRALDLLVDQRVLLAHAERDTTIVVTDAQVTEQVDTRVASIAGQLGGEEALSAYYGRTIEEIKATLREDIRQQLMSQQYQSRRLREVTVTPSEVRAFYAAIPAADIPEVPDLVRVAHVVRKPGVDAAASARTRAFAVALRDSILAGTATIEELAGRHSDDPGSARNGGRYDRFNLRELVPEFGAVASSLQPGGLSSVFETDFGFHVMRLNTRQGDLVSFNHVLLRLDEGAADASGALQMLATLRDSIVTHGVPFEAIAKRHSEDPYSAARGGFVSDPRTGERDLRLEGLGPLWRRTLDTLALGTVSAPAEVQLLDGTQAYHIVVLQRRTPAHRLSIETDYALLNGYALQEKRQRELDTWLRELRQTVYVDIKTARYSPSAG